MVKPIFELALERVYPEDRQLVQQVTAGVAKNGRDVDVEHRLQMPDGTVKTIRVLGHTSREPDGKSIFLGAITDISAIENALEEIRTLRTPRIW